MHLETSGSFTTYRANKSICYRKSRIIENEVKFPAVPLQITQALQVPLSAIFVDLEGCWDFDAATSDWFREFSCHVDGDQTG